MKIGILSIHLMFSKEMIRPRLRITGAPLPCFSPEYFSFGQPALLSSVAEPEPDIGQISPPTLTVNPPDVRQDFPPLTETGVVEDTPHHRETRP